MATNGIRSHARNNQDMHWFQSRSNLSKAGQALYHSGAIVKVLKRACYHNKNVLALCEWRALELIDLRSSRHMLNWLINATFFFLAQTVQYCVSSDFESTT